MLRFQAPPAAALVTELVNVPAPLVVLVDSGELAVRETRGLLEKAGHRVALVSPQPPDAAVARVVELAPDLAVLNSQALGAGAHSAIGRLGQQLPVMPIILLSARADGAERIAGLTAGADDFVPRPTSPKEVVARVRAVLRRTLGPPAPRPEPLLVAGPLVVDQTRRQVRVFGDEVRLTLREFDVLAFLMRHPQQPFRREALLEQVWGYTFGEPSTVTVHIRRLRTKVEPDPVRPTAIRTVWGIGYLFDPDGATAWAPAVGSSDGQQPALGDADPDGCVDEPDVAHRLGEVP